MNNFKKILIILTLFMLGVTVYKIIDTYALFQSEMAGTLTPGIGRWTIYLNENDVTNGTTKEFTMDTFNIVQSEYTAEGKIAPGMSGTFEISICPKDTDVSIRYDISIDDSKLNGQQIKLVSVEETNNNKTVVKTAPNTYTAVILLNDINEDYNDIIKISFVWENNEDYNENDTAIGTAYDSKLEIPVTVHASQYLGETIEEYIEEEI